MSQTPSAKDILFERFSKQKLAPLYIIRGPISTENPKELFEEWVEEFCEEIIKAEKGCSREQAREMRTLGHSDIVVIRKEEDAREYRVKDEGISEFNKAHSYPPLEFKAKLVFVMEAQLLTQIIANKWLKTLEEPLENVVTFLVVDEQTSLLQTIESRAITLRLKAKSPLESWSPLEGHAFSHYLSKTLESGHDFKKSELKELNNYINNPRSFHLIEFIKGGLRQRKFLYDTLTSFMERASTPLHLKEQWLKQLQWFEKAQAFNNAPAQRFMGLIQVIEQCS